MGPDHAELMCDRAHPSLAPEIHRVDCGAQAKLPMKRRCQVNVALVADWARELGFERTVA